MVNSEANPHSRSIFGPLVLIALGTLWLLNAQGVISVDNVWAVVRFWPVLLIAAGVDALLRWRWPLLANLVNVAVVGLVVAAIIFAPRLGLTASGGWMNALPFMLGGTTGSGQVITETRAVSDFDSVAFGSFGELTIRAGEQEALTIEGEDNLLREIHTEVRGGTLYVDFTERNGWARVRPTRPIRFTLTVVALEKLDLSGAGNVTVNDLRTGRLQATLSGAGNLALANLDADEAVASITGAGSLEAAGVTEHLEVIVSGLGDFKGADLQSETARVHLTGVGGATVWVMRRLEAIISGVGSVQYYGQPTLNKTVSGLGSVRALGDR